VIYLYTNKPQFDYEISEEIRLFLACDKIEMVGRSFIPPSRTDLFFMHDVKKISKNNFISTVKSNGSKSDPYRYEFRIDENETELIKKRDMKFAIKLSFYHFLKNDTKTRMPWGCLTGIRPTKMLRQLTLREGEDGAIHYMKNVLDVSSQKIDLAKSIVERQEITIKTITEKSADIYIHIPFCPSICHYCSFSSVKATNKRLQAEYISAVKDEIKNSMAIIDDHNIRSIYIGGGTPTSIGQDILEDLLAYIKKVLPKVPEYTVEAGRPDTLSIDYLNLLKKYGVNRISVNPQTMKQSTLSSIGRDHTVTQFLSAFKQARAVGFNNINVDLIYGLPNETLFDMKRSLRKILKLNPECITIHTLSIKNSAKFDRDIKYKSNEKIVDRAVRWGNKKCIEKNVTPYYMYRQKYMKGNLENVGYAKDGFESIYNIDMMEEVCSIIGFGAGAVSKHVFYGQNLLHRCFNIKDIRMYIERLSQMVQRKNDLYFDKNYNKK